MFATRFQFLIIKNISKVKETQDKKLWNLLPKNIGKNSDTCQDPDKVIFNFSSYNLNDHEKLVLCKGLNFAIPPKAIEYSELLLPFEMLFREITSSDIGDFNKECVKSRLRDNRHLSKFPGYLTKIFPERRLKH